MKYVYNFKMGRSFYELLDENMQIVIEANSLAKADNELFDMFLDLFESYEDESEE